MAILVLIGVVLCSPSATLSVPVGVTCSSAKSSDFFATDVAVAMVLDREALYLEGVLTLPGWAAFTLSDLAMVLLPESDRCTSGNFFFFF